jgi:hypothetical protein
MIKYPAQIDDSISLPVVTSTTSLSPVLFNRLRDAIIRVESELGIKPSAVFGTVRERLDYLQGIMSSSLVTLNGDLGGTQTNVKVIGINGKPVLDNELKDGYVLSWDVYNQSWSPQYVSIDNLAVPFAILLKPAESILVEMNHSLSNPFFIAEYTVDQGLLQSAILTDDQGNPQKVVTSTPFSFSSDQSYIKNNFKDTVTVTLTAINNKFKTRTSSVRFIWTQRLYWGSSPAGVINQSFVTSLSDSELTLTRKKTFSTNAGPGEYIYFACRSDYDTPIFTVNEISGGFSLAGTTTINGELFSVYQSDNDGLGNTTVFVS